MQNKSTTRRRTRHLRLESMEGRLMLSTTSVEFDFSNWNAAQIDLVHGHYAFASVNSDWQSAHLAGGFLRFETLDPVVFVDADRTSASGEISTEELDALINRDDGYVNNFGGGFESWSQPVPSGMNGMGIPRAVIANSITGREADKLGAAGVTQQFENSTSVSDGGPISINSILASLGPGRTLETKENTSTKLAGDVVSDRVKPAAVASSVNTSPRVAISGEWARGMALELAGGEPAHNARPAAESDKPDATADKAQGSAERLSAAKPGASATDGIDRTAATSTNGSPSARRASRNAVNSWDAFSLFGANTGRATPSTPANTGTLLGQPASAHTDDAAYAVHAVAFEQLDDANPQAGDSFAHTAFRSSLNAAPLLMVLALERISIGNSRRSNREVALSRGHERPSDHNPGDRH